MAILFYSTVVRKPAFGRNLTEVAAVMGDKYALASASKRYVRVCARIRVFRFEPSRVVGADDGTFVSLNDMPGPMRLCESVGRVS